MAEKYYMLAFPGPKAEEVLQKLEPFDLSKIKYHQAHLFGKGQRTRFACAHRLHRGSAAPDFHGADRIGDNLFANCLLALDAANGRRLWHFQAVHHDIWDRDFPSPPTLVTVRRDGRLVDAVAQTTKQDHVFVLDRETGAPLFPVDERPMPASQVPGERASPTQPVPRAPEPFARQRLTADLLTRRTPEAQAWALAAFARMHTEGPFTPLRLGTDTVVFPGFDGGAEWGGSAYDRESGRLFVNANDLAWTGALAPDDGGGSGRGVYLRACASCHRDDRRGTPPQIPALSSLTLSAERLTAVRRALEWAQALRAAQDSAAPGVTPAPGPAPIPGVDSGATGGR